MLLIALGCAALSTLAATTDVRADQPPILNATEHNDLRDIKLPSSGLSPRAADALLQHLLAVLNKEWDGRFADQEQCRSPEKTGPTSMWAYREGLLQEWYLQISGLPETVDIDRSRIPPQVRYKRQTLHPYLLLSRSWIYLAGQKDARELVRSWRDAIANEVVRNQEAILSRSKEGQIDYSAVPQLEALRYMRRRLPSGGFPEKAIQQIEEGAGSGAGGRGRPSTDPQPLTLKALCKIGSWAGQGSCKTGTFYFPANWHGRSSSSRSPKP